MRTYSFWVIAMCPCHVAIDGMYLAQMGVQNVDYNGMEWKKKVPGPICQRLMKKEV